MKTIHITTWIAVALLSAGTASAQGNQGRRGAGYGGPPKSDGERATRQEECQKAGGGVCDRQRQRQCSGKGKGRGNGQGNGPHDGTGPGGGGPIRSNEN